MNKILAKEHLSGNIRLSIRLWRILTAHDFDMGNPGLKQLKKNGLKTAKIPLLK